MRNTMFPTIDLAATGANITRLRKDRGLSVRDLQSYFGFEEPVAIYKWQKGTSLPTVDNLYALSALLEVPMNEILVSTKPKLNIITREEQAGACSSVFSDMIFRAQQKFALSVGIQPVLSHWQFPLDSKWLFSPDSKIGRFFLTKRLTPFSLLSYLVQRKTSLNSWLNFNREFLCKKHLKQLHEAKIRTKRAKRYKMFHSLSCTPSFYLLLHSKKAKGIRLNN